MKMRTVIMTIVALILVLPPGATGQEIHIEFDDDWADRLSFRMEVLGDRLFRMGERVSRIVDRAVVRTLDRVEVRIEDDAWDPVVSMESSSFQEGDFSWEGRVNSGDVLEIKGVNGPVYAEPATGDRVEVIAEKRGRRSDPDPVRIEVLEHAAGVTICAVYPSDGRRANRCAPGDDGRLNTRKNDVRVTFRVKVPTGVRFVGKTVNGDVEALDLSSDAQVRSVNGDVEVSTRGVARASTVNGAIRIR